MHQVASQRSTTSRTRGGAPDPATRLCSPLVAWWAFALVTAGCAGTSSVAGLRFEDPRGDDHGPGGYVYPTGGGFGPGSLDLREVRLAPSGDEVVVTVRFARQVPILTQVPVSPDRRADLFPQTVDIYLDLDGLPGSGSTAALPGRNVAFPEGSGWEVCVVLSPIPGRLGQLVDRVRLAGLVEIPPLVQVRRDTLRATIPRALFAGANLEDAGVAVLVTGTTLSTTFKSFVDSDAPTAHVREVTEQPGFCDRWEEAADGAPCTFGGCGESCGVHPRVIDVLHPEPGVQERLLADFDPPTGRLALAPVVYRSGREVELPPPPVDLLLPVTDRRAGLVTVLLPPDTPPGLDVGALGSGLDRAGNAVATLVVLSTHEAGLVVLKVVEGQPRDVAHVRLGWRPPFVPNR